jgi:hypothetical protein
MNWDRFVRFATESFYSREPPLTLHFIFPCLTFITQRRPEFELWVHTEGVRKKRAQAIARNTLCLVATTSSSSGVRRRFGGTNHLNIQGREVSPTSVRNNQLLNTATFRRKLPQILTRQNPKINHFYVELLFYLNT